MSDAEPTPTGVTIQSVVGGEPTDAEMAAISAAASVLLFAPVVVGAEPEQVSRWRFSGRWWTKPVPLRRRRPY